MIKNCFQMSSSFLIFYGWLYTGFMVYIQTQMISVVVLVERKNALVLFYLFFIIQVQDQSS